MGNISQSACVSMLCIYLKLRIAHLGDIQWSDQRLCQLNMGTLLDPAAEKGHGTEGTDVSELLVGHTAETQTRDKETAFGAWEEKMIGYI